MVRVRVGAIALVVGSLLVLTACGGGEAGSTAGPTEPVGVESIEPSPTPSPTSGAYVSPAPTSEADAIAHATRAYEFYLATAGEIVAGQADVSKIDEIARGNAAGYVREEFNVLKETGTSVTYADVFEVFLNNSFVDQQMLTEGSGLPNSAVQLVGCFDTTARQGTNRDGSPVTFFATPRFIVQSTVVYDEIAGSWFVIEDIPVLRDGLVSCES